MSEEKTVENTLLSEKEEVIIGEEKFEITALVRAQYKPLMGVFAEVVMAFDWDLLDDIEDNIGALINVISDTALMELYKISTDKSKEWLNNNMTFNQEMELFQAICKVNDIQKMVDNFLQTLIMVNNLRKAKEQSEKKGSRN